MNVVIIDYGMGNIKSIIGALKYLGINKVKVSSNPSDITDSDKIILPGVGAFPLAIKNIKRLHLDEYLQNEILEKKKPVLGICLGMQLMGKSSTEGGLISGLGFIDSKVEGFSDEFIKVPHIGFNQVRINKNSRLFDAIEDFSDFYFVHSYKMTSEINISQSLCEYGSNFIASYELDNIAGVQFHPELSQTNGLKLLKNFLYKF
ncbi:imidazole glycerol phosphate synthase subunit HisH [Candidatus Thioglobus sp.]|nr:imidazole glycerol phosphate synthase subunit HisH [Candidatus Thioglobus sp.]